MTRDRNTFRTGTAKHETEADVWDFLDSGDVAAGFQEIWEHTESELALSLLPGTEQTASRVSETKDNQVKPADKYPGTDNLVEEYLDRFPGSGL
jgi:hypothetical protein